MIYLLSCAVLIQILFKLITLPTYYIVIYNTSSSDESFNIEEICESLKKLEKTIKKLQENNKKDDDVKGLLFCKVNVAVKEIEVIQSLLKNNTQVQPIKEKTANILCGCSLPPFLGGWGPVQIKVDYHGYKAKVQTIEEKLTALEYYVLKMNELAQREKEAIDLLENEKNDVNTKNEVKDLDKIEFD
ncbi:hypothetical protein GVAV_001268 [Gurleya vavrai]